MTNLATPPIDHRAADVDALEAAFQLPAYRTASSKLGERLVFAMFAALAIGGVAIVAQTIAA